MTLVKVYNKDTDLPEYMQKYWVPHIGDGLYVRNVIFRLWIYSAWSRNVLRPRFGLKNKFGRSTFRLHVAWLSKKDHANLKMQQQKWNLFLKTHKKTQSK